MWQELIYFTRAFEDTCYRLLWFQGLLGTIGGIIMWQFGFYWCDTPNHTTAPHGHTAHSLHALLMAAAALDLCVCHDHSHRLTRRITTPSGTRTASRTATTSLAGRSPPPPSRPSRSKA